MTNWADLYAALGFAYACWYFLLNCRDLDAQRVLASFGVDPRRGIILAFFVAFLCWPVLFIHDIKHDGRWKG